MIALEEFSPYVGDRLIKKTDDYCLIVPREFIPTVPVYCDNCELLMRSRDDELAWTNYGCCSICAMEWAEPKKLRWMEGWRPSREEVKQALEARKFLTIKLEI